MYKKAVRFRDKKTYYVDSKDDFFKYINKGGFVYAHWDGSAQTEELIKKETKATLRCIPLDLKKEPGICLFSGNPSKGRVLFAKNY